MNPAQPVVTSGIAQVPARRRACGFTALYVAAGYLVPIPLVAVALIV